MALIKCPECGKEVSDRAVSCPNCAYPIEAESPEGEVRIKMSTDVFFKIRIINNETGKDLWEGRSQEVAKIYLEKPVQVTFRGGGYNMFGPATIDPKKGKKWEFSSSPGILLPKYVLNVVDVIDSD